MNVQQAQAQINELKSVYSNLSGFHFKERTMLCDYRDRAWADYLRSGFTAKDLDTVLHYLKAKIAKGDRKMNSMRFSNIIENLAMFEDLLCMAQAENRNTKRPMTAKERVIQQARPTVSEPPPQTIHVKKASDVNWIAELRRAVE